MMKGLGHRGEWQRRPWAVAEASVGSGGYVRYRMAEMFSRVHASRENDHIVCALHPVSVIHYIFIQLFLKNNFRNLIRESRLLQVSRAWYPSSSIPFADGSWDPRGRGVERVLRACPPPLRPLPHVARWPLADSPANLGRW